jgi:hypothetical protein
VNTTARTRKTRGNSIPAPCPARPGRPSRGAGSSCPHPTQEESAGRAQAGPSMGLP